MSKNKLRNKKIFWKYMKMKIQQKPWDTLKAYSEGRFIDLSAYIKNKHK